MKVDKDNIDTLLGRQIDVPIGALEFQERYLDPFSLLSDRGSQTPESVPGPSAQLPLRW
jgi:hypothetical protein